MARHPNRQQLASWLNGEHSDHHLNEHIDECEKCAEKLGDLDTSLPPQGAENNVRAITPELRPALLKLLQPPEDLHARITERITARLQDRSDADLFGSLLGVPIEMGRVFLDQE